MQLIHPAEAVFHRVGGLDLTTRFTEGELPVIDEEDWIEDSEPVDIVFSSDCNLESAASVREFTPRAGDATGRRFTDALGERRWIEIPSYGLARPSDFLDDFSRHIAAEARAWAFGQSSAHHEALRLIKSGLAPELEILLQYDFARYQKTRSAYITGPTSLSIKALPSDAQTMPGQAPLPRMITAQCDVLVNMYLSEQLSKLFGHADAPLLKKILANDAVSTHVAYVALRIITQGTVWIMADKERRDLENNINNRSLQAQLQGSLNGLVHAFASKRQGMDFLKLKNEMPLEAALFYSNLESYEGENAFPAWKNPRFWLPSLHDVVTRPFQPKQAFVL